MADDFDMFGPFGWDTDGGEDWSAGSIAVLDLDAHLGKDLLLIAEPWALLDVSDDDGLDVFPPFGEIDDGGWATAAAQTETLYIAATTGRSTDNDDEPPAQHVPGLLLPWNFGARLFDGVNPLARGSENIGILRMVDPSGRLDPLNGRNWDSVDLTIKRGPRTAQYRDWPVIGRFKSNGLLRDLNEKQLRVRDLGWQMNAALHGETYEGTGGVEGMASLKGVLKPWALGTCYNVAPVLLDTTDQIFQWSLTSSQACTQLLHGAIPLIFNADHASYAALAAAVIPAGRYDTCLALSLARPNVALQYEIRVDVVGDAETYEGHPAPMTRAAIARRIVTARGANALDDAEEIDASSFQTMDAYHSAPVGFHFAADTTKAAALDRVLQGVLGWRRMRPDGRLTIGWVEAPENMTAAVTFEFARHGMGIPRLVVSEPPRQGTRIGYRFNNARQPDRGSLAPLADEDEKTQRGQEASFAEDLAPAIGTLWPTSEIVTIADAGFRDQADAVLEAQRQQEIFKSVRYRWEIEMQVDPFIDLIGYAAALTSAPQVVGEGRAMLCVGINATGTSISVLEFFV